MNKTVKSILTAVAVVCMVATGLSLSAAAILGNGKKEVKKVRANELTHKKVLAVEAWYFISNNTTPSTQVISGTPASSLPVSGSCQQNNDGDICAVRLSFPDTPPSLNGLTVKDAIDDYDATIVTSGGNPVYARHPEE